jgi:transposase
MNQIPKARYTKEFREEAVKLAMAVGASEASRRLSIPLKSLANWQRASKAGTGGRWSESEAPDGIRSGTAAGQTGAGRSEDGARPAKKFAAYFAKESR